ncbi:MAG TPA: lysine 2,3-aminomutase, partial [Thermoanaerobaculia bacterium]|nr:lysine 2,3-aminomutase [Thermoanaerobaculia bacterium]
MPASSVKILSGDDGFADFCNIVGMSEGEASARRVLLRQSFMPFKVTQYYAETIARLRDPYRTHLINIVVPPNNFAPFTGRFDPYGNVRVRQGTHPFLQHKYEKTLLLHIDDFCIANCQFCYKVKEIRHDKTVQLSYNRKLLDTLAYIDANPEIDNVLFTGGDPASFRRSRELVTLIDGLLSHRQIRIVRFATKALAYDPVRLTDASLLSYFDQIRRRSGKQVAIIAHVSHPAEFTTQACDAISCLHQVGVQIRAQPTIARGINDSVPVLIEL